MKRVLSKQSAVFFGRIKAWSYILISIACVLQADVSLGQSDKGLESILISDAAIPDMLALEKKNVLPESTLKLMFKIKEDSLKNRLRQVQSSIDFLLKRSAQVEDVFERTQREAEKITGEAQTASTIFPTSRVAAEQLLVSAQLELQKVTWDLASEVALLESVVIAKERSETKPQKIEEMLSALESKKIEEELQSAEKNLEVVEALSKQGSISTSEAIKARQSVSKAKSALQIHELRSSLALAQRDVLKDAQSVEIKTQVMRLTVRKEQIEKSIKELIRSTNALTAIEVQLTRARRNEEQFATLSKSLNELQRKKDEIEVLQEAIKSAESTEK